MAMSNHAVALSMVASKSRTSHLHRVVQAKKSFDAPSYGQKDEVCDAGDR
ncbi:hypothetical protein [Sphingomonas sp. NBWT7]|nr:hypothetical protein [Sphingomonas sp. NBWT7]